MQTLEDTSTALNDERGAVAESTGTDAWSWAFSQRLELGSLLGVLVIAFLAVLIVGGVALVTSMLTQHDLVNAQISTLSSQSTMIDTLVKATADAAGARAKAEDAKAEAERAQRQADLTNWTVLNLEGLMKEKGVKVPSSLRPKNLSGNDGARAK